MESGGCSDELCSEDGMACKQFLWKCMLVRFEVLYCSDVVFFFSSRRRHTRFDCDWSSDVCSSDLAPLDRAFASRRTHAPNRPRILFEIGREILGRAHDLRPGNAIRAWPFLSACQIGRASCRERV